jgi:hypothetical protein
MVRVASCIEVLTELQEVRPTIASKVKRGVREGEFICEDRSGIVLIVITVYLFSGLDIVVLGA